MEETKTQVQTQLKLPVVLVHGMHAKDDSIYSSPLWGRIPAALRDLGYEVFFGNTDAWGAPEHNAHQLAYAITEVLDRTQAPKVHLVIHSKGSLDTRICLYLPGVADEVASVTYLGPPHHGVRMCTVLTWEKIVIPFFVRPYMEKQFKERGDVEPRPMEVLRSLSVKGAQAIYDATPDIPGILTRSYAYVPHPKGKNRLDLRRLFIKLFDGENDGIVPLWSTESPDRIIVQVQEGVKYTHDDSYDLNRKDITLTMPDGTVYPTPVDLVVATVEEFNARAVESLATNQKSGDSANTSKFTTSQFGGGLSSKATNLAAADSMRPDGTQQAKPA